MIDLKYLLIDSVIFHRQIADILIDTSIDCYIYWLIKGFLDYWSDRLHIDR